MMSTVILLVFCHGFVSVMSSYSAGAGGRDNFTHSDFADIKDRYQEDFKLNASIGFRNLSVNNSSEHYQLATAGNLSSVDIFDDVMPGNYSEEPSSNNTLSDETATFNPSTRISQETATRGTAHYNTILSLQNKSVTVASRYNIPENQSAQIINDSFAYAKDAFENRTLSGNTTRTLSSSEIDANESLTTSPSTLQGIISTINMLPLSSPDTKRNNTDFLTNISDVLTTIFSYGERTTVSAIHTKVTSSVQIKTTRTLQKHHHGVFQTLLLESLRHGASTRHQAPVNDDPFESLIWRDKKYLISVLVPIGVGIIGSVVIVIVAYFVRSFRRKQKRRAFRSPRRIFKPQAQLEVMDKIVLLDDSSDDGF